jgi:hypothetical protein
MPLPTEPIAKAVQPSSSQELHYLREAQSKSNHRAALFALSPVGNKDMNVRQPTGKDFAGRK